MALERRGAVRGKVRFDVTKRNQLAVFQRPQPEAIFVSDALIRASESPKNCRMPTRMSSLFFTLMPCALNFSLSATTASCSDFGIVTEYFLTLLCNGFNDGLSVPADWDSPLKSFLDKASCPRPGVGLDCLLSAGSRLEARTVCGATFAFPEVFDGMG